VPANAKHPILFDIRCELQVLSEAAHNVYIILKKLEKCDKKSCMYCTTEPQMQEKDSIGVVTLACCLLVHIFAKSYWKQLSVLFGLVVGYIVAVCMGMVDFSALSGTSVIALPHIMPFKPEFN
jgi:xanthine/uracil permease